jgi:hypothetical protein
MNETHSPSFVIPPLAASANDANLNTTDTLHFCFNEFLICKSEFALASSGKSVATIRSARATMRDVCAIVTERGAGCDGRCGVSAVQTARTKTPAAYGEVVWSWRRDPGVKPMERSIGDGGKTGRSPGRARSKP